MLLLLEISLLHLILPVALLSHSTGGRGVDGLWPWPWQGGWGDPDFISPYQLHCCLLETGWPRPLPTRPTHSTGGGAGYHCSVCILNVSYSPLRCLICSSFQYLILTYILVTYFSIHASLAWNQLASSYPTSCIAVGWSWMTPTPSQDPPIPQGGGGLMGYDHDHGRGGGGGTRNLEHIYYIVYIYI